MFDEVKRPGAVGVLAALTAIVFKWVSDVFKGPLLASILIIAALALLSALVNRLLAVNSRRRDARALLRIPPDTTAAQADPHALGIFPARHAVERDASGLPVYVERDIDAQLRAALTVENALVVVVGPPLAGKTRTALEAVRTSFPDARVLYPRTGDAVRCLADSDLARDKDGSVVLWLDDLKRYQSALDPDTWRRLIRAWPGIRAVTTMRTDDYDALCRAGGELGESARFLLARASRFPLALHWTPTEIAGAMQQHPKLRISRGDVVPRAFALDWNEWTQPPESRHRAQEDRGGIGGRWNPRTRGPWSPRLRAFSPLDLLSVVLCGLLASVIGFGLVLWLVTGSFRPAAAPPSPAEQLSEIRASAIFAGDDVQRWPASLQGPGQNSYIFYSHSKSFGRMVGGGDPPPTDTLRVYDEYGTHIARSFMFAPTYLSGDSRLTGDAEFFERRSLTDLVGAGAPQLVGVYSAADQPGSPALPVIMYWDETAKGYVVNALMQQRPSLAAVPHPSRAALAYRAAYTSLSALETHMPVGPPYIVGYPVQDLAIVDGPNGPRIVVGYVAQTVGSPPRVSRLEVQAWSIGQDQATGDPTLQTRCVLRGDVSRRFFVTPLPGLSYPTLLKEFWKQFDPQALC